MFSFGSRLRRRLLAYSFTNESARHHLRELARILEADPANLGRELQRLVRAGLFLAETSGRQKYFRLNRAYPLYKELRGIVRKTIGAEASVREALADLDGVQAAYIYGSYARNQQHASSDIDLLIIGNLQPEQFEGRVRKIERLLGREINTIVMTPEEVTLRRRKRDAFLRDVWKNPRIVLIEER